MHIRVFSMLLPFVVPPDQAASYGAGLRYCVGAGGVPVKDTAAVIQCILTHHVLFCMLPLPVATC
jgi:hypothetical protein